MTTRRRHVSHGRTKAARGLDCFDTPVEALAPLFAHEPLLRGVKSVCEPFCGLGNLVLPLRQRGLVVHASDIVDRGCPDSTVLDFAKMTERPPGCDVMLTNPAFDGAMDHIEHGWALGFRLIILLLATSFLHTAERFDRLHKTGRLRRVFPLADRLQDMHDANYIAAGGEKKSQSQIHTWFTFDSNYRGPATIVPVSLKRPAEHMPWVHTQSCARCRKSFPPSRASMRFCSNACRLAAYRDGLGVTPFGVSGVTRPGVRY